jgi:glycosyltransferase involved in cell wall biosynthesis
MKILHVVTTIERGGAENHLADLVRAQVAKGHTVMVAYLKRPPYWQPEFEKAGIQVVALGMRRYGDPRAVFRLRRAVQNFAPAVVHAHMPPAELYARVALLGLSHIPLVISKHNDEPFYPGRYADALGRWVASRAAFIIAISSAVNAYTAKRRFSPADRIVTIPYGLDTRPYSAVAPSAIEALRHEWAVPTDALLFGTVARFVPQKSLHDLLQGFALYRSTGGRPARLVLVGRGPLESELKALADRLGIAGEVVWGGFREDVPTVMRSLDVFVLTSIYEGLGLVLLEAMAAEKPVVATRVSAIPEVVDEGVSGLLIPPRDPAALAEAFSRMSADDVRHTMGQRGRARVQAVFDLDVMVDRTDDVYARSCALNNSGKGGTA